MLLRIGYLLLLSMLSFIAYSQVPLSTALSIAPPSSDSSLIYLANVFGTVEGVISSSGSQIFGHMMGMFNLTVLALGSIVIMYTLIVGTLNTAHEGEFLGKHWSSIWLPVRATVGMTLLVPKTSGFCLMQVIVMWVVVQGVGAADKVWSEALDYLNMGGKLVSIQNSSENMGGETKKHNRFIPNPSYNGAAVILTGQVCAYMMQRELEKIHDDYHAKANPTDGSDPSGPCAPNAVKSNELKSFCDNPVPDFLSDLNAVTFMKPKTASISSAQESDVASQSETWSMPIPNFNSEVPIFYQNLSTNKICGMLFWNSMSSNDAQKNLNLSDAQADTITKSRGIATQQMIDFLQPVARAMVDNDPEINKNLNPGASPIAFSQYGVALNNNGDVCQEKGECYTWGSSKGGSQYSVLFGGNEFFNAVNAYDGVMQPMLDLQKNSNQTNAKEFIGDAKRQGWIHAGGYFFDLVRLSGDPTTSTEQDTKSGLNKSVIPSLNACTDSSEGSLCELGKDKANSILDSINNLITGETITVEASSKSVCTHPLTYSFNNAATAATKGYVTSKGSGSNGGMSTAQDFQDLACSSTALGYIGNTYFLSIPGQPNYTIPQLEFPNFDSWTPIRLPKFKLKKKCRNIFCVDMFFNAVVLSFAYIIQLLGHLFYDVLMMFILVPMITTMFAMVFGAFVDILDQLRNMHLSPIVDIANLGATMLQAGGEISIMMIVSTIGAGLSLIAFPSVALVVLVAILCMAPFITVWVTYFFSMGFVTAYYVPLYPYMLFIFGVIAWLMAVIEAMVAAPIVALGIMSPEGEGILGKSETGMMILVNVFLRPSMMVIGFITGTILTYVGVWILNFQFDVVAAHLINYDPKETVAGRAGVKFDKSFFAQIFGVGSYIALYVGLYTTIAQKSFGLIFQLPDKVLRWIGSQQESFGQEVQHWGDESKQKIEQAGQPASKAVGTSAEAFKDQLMEGSDDKGKGGGVTPK